MLEGLRLLALQEILQRDSSLLLHYDYLLAELFVIQHFGFEDELGMLGIQQLAVVLRHFQLPQVSVFVAGIQGVGNHLEMRLAFRLEEVLLHLDLENVEEKDMVLLSPVDIHYFFIHQLLHELVQIKQFLLDCEALDSLQVVQRRLVAQQHVGMLYLGVLKEPNQVVVEKLL